MTRHLSTSLLLLAFVPIAGQSTQNVVQEGFTLSVLTTGLEYPWEITWGPDGHLWVNARPSASPASIRLTEPRTSPSRSRKLSRASLRTACSD